MGSQCSRLCCRPFKKRLTIKERVQSIFTQAPSPPSELYCKHKAVKIYEYLKDRRSQIQNCISEFKLIISSIATESYAESETNITILLYSLRTLAEHLKEFLPITYNFLYQLMQNPYFIHVKVIVYETLRITTEMYPDENINDLEDIMIELIKYLSEPKNVSQHEIKLLSAIIVPLHDKSARNNFFD